MSLRAAPAAAAALRRRGPGRGGWAGLEGAVGRGGPAGDPPDLELVVLPDVAEVQAPQHHHPGWIVAFVEERAQALRLEDPEALLDHLGVPGIESPAVGLDGVVAQRRDETAERREGAR